MVIRYSDLITTLTHLRLRLAAQEELRNINRLRRIFPALSVRWATSEDSYELTARPSFPHGDDPLLDRLPGLGESAIWPPATVEGSGDDPSEHSGSLFSSPGSRTSSGSNPLPDTALTRPRPVSNHASLLTLELMSMLTSWGGDGGSPDPPQGLSEEEQASLDVKLMTAAMTDNATAEPVVCSICLEAFTTKYLELDSTVSVCEEVGGYQLCRLPCNHVFCALCVKDWLKQSRSCPNCRLALDDIPTLYREREGLIPFWWAKGEAAPPPPLSELSSQSFISCPATTSAGTQLSLSAQFTHSATSVLQTPDTVSTTSSTAGLMTSYRQQSRLSSWSSPSLSSTRPTSHSRGSSSSSSVSLPQSSETSRPDSRSSTPVLNHSVARRHWVVSSLSTSAVSSTRRASANDTPLPPPRAPSPLPLLISEALPSARGLPMIPPIERRRPRDPESGLRAVRLLRHDRETRRLPLVMLSDRPTAGRAGGRSPSRSPRMPVSALLPARLGSATGHAASPLQTLRLTDILHQNGSVIGDDDEGPPFAARGEQRLVPHAPRVGRPVASYKRQFLGGT